MHVKDKTEMTACLLVYGLNHDSNISRQILQEVYAFRLSVCFTFKYRQQSDSVCWDFIALGWFNGSIIIIIIIITIIISKISHNVIYTNESYY